MLDMRTKSVCVIIVSIGILYAMPQKVYHQTFYDIFNNSFLISVIFGTVITE